MHSMSSLTSLHFLIGVCFLASCSSSDEKESTSMITYPSTEKSDVVDSYFGQSVPDAYRWLENDTSEATAAWVKAQNEVTFSYLNGIPGRNEIRVRLEELWNFPKRTSPYQVGEYYFFGSNDGLQNQYVIMKQKGLEGEPEVFLDPNTVNPEGTTTLSISGYSKNQARYFPRPWNGSNSLERVGRKTASTIADIPHQRREQSIRPPTRTTWSIIIK
jgi:prolyl oligopeptidase